MVINTAKSSVRFREAIEQADREFDARPRRDITKDARYIMMKNILSSNESNL